MPRSGSSTVVSQVLPAEGFSCLRKPGIRLTLPPSATYDCEVLEKIEYRVELPAWASVEESGGQSLPFGSAPAADQDVARALASPPDEHLDGLAALEAEPGPGTAHAHCPGRLPACRVAARYLSRIARLGRPSAMRSSARCDAVSPGPIRSSPQPVRRTRAVAARRVSSAAQPARSAALGRAGGRSRRRAVRRRCR